MGRGLYMETTMGLLKRDIRSLDDTYMEPESLWRIPICSLRASCCLSKSSTGGHGLYLMSKFCNTC